MQGSLFSALVTAAWWMTIMLTSSTASPCPAWSYDPSLPNGPAHWGDLCSEYASCRDGSSQSPIDLVSSLQVQGQISSLEYNYGTVSNFTLINTRYTIEGTDLGTKNTLSFVGLHTYTLSEFLFHAPSEHHINGQQFPMEIHYLHSDENGNYATLVLMYNNSEGGGGTSWFLQMMAILLPDVPTDGSSTNVPSIDIASQVNITDGFYHYEGSATTPPCSPGVQWFVAKNPIMVDPVILSKFTAVLNNARPIQPLNGREPALFIPGTPSVVDKWVFAIGMAGLGALGLLVILGIARYAYRYYSAKRYENQQELVGFLGSTNNEHL